MRGRWLVRSLQALLLPAMFLAVHGCATLKDPVVQVEEQDADRPVLLKRGQVMEVRLMTFPGRGLTISLGSVVAPTLALDGRPTHNDDAIRGGMSGTGSYEVWRFRAVQPGQAQVRMDYRLQWETTGAPTRSVTYQVTVQ